MRQRIKEIYEIIFNALGEQGWWPAESPFEVIVGAILTQATNWRNVEKAINNLKELELLDPHRLNELPLDQLAYLIRPVGYYNQKARKLKNFLKWFLTNYDGSIDRLRSETVDVLREKLLAIRGIGEETADSILLYALDKPIFVVDTYTHRILHRHCLADEVMTYRELQALFMDNLEPSPPLFKEFHALLVVIGKRFCRKRKPLCKDCPLGSLTERRDME